MTDPVFTPGTAADVPAEAQAPDVGRGSQARPTSNPGGTRRAELKAASVLIGVLAVIGAILGLVWEGWSPPGPAGGVLPGGIQADETEAFVAGDGRYALLTVIVGLLAGWATWYVLRRVRGPIAALALVVGSLVGAALTDFVGWVVRGDSDHGKVGTLIAHLPLTVHMHALWFVEAIAAVLVYTLFVAFAVDDDLGRPDPAWDARQAVRHPHWPASEPIGAAVPPVPPSVEANRGLQQPWRDSDGAGPA